MINSKCPLIQAVLICGILQFIWHCIDVVKRVSAF